MKTIILIATLATVVGCARGGPFRDLDFEEAQTNPTGRTEMPFPLNWSNAVTSRLGQLFSPTALN